MHIRHLFPGLHGSKQLLCKFRPYKSVRSVFFSRAFPGRGHSYLFSMSNEEEEPSTPTDQETRFSCFEAKLVALSSCFEALAHTFHARSALDQLCHRIQTSKKIFCQQKTLTCSTQQKVSSVFRTKRLIFPTRTFLRTVRAAVLKVHDGVAERIDNACTKTKMPWNSSQAFKPNTFVSRTVNVFKVPRVNLELWDCLLDKVKKRDVGFQAFQKGFNQRYCLSSQSCQQTRGSQEK